MNTRKQNTIRNFSNHSVDPRELRDTEIIEDSELMDEVGPGGSVYPYCELKQDYFDFLLRRRETAERKLFSMRRWNDNSEVLTVEIG